MSNDPQRDTPANGRSKPADGGSTARPHWKSSRFVLALELLSGLSAPPSLAYMIFRTLNVTDSTAYLLSFLIVIASSAILLFVFGRKYLRLLLLMLLSAVCVALAIALGLTLYYRTDPWSEWEKKLSNGVNKCQRTDYPCLVAALEQPHPPPDSKLLIARLESDLRAGAIIMKHDALREMLNTRLGIKDTFTGTGFAQPAGEDKDYSAARIPEYLVPNYKETSKGVWTWQFDPLDPRLERTLEQVVKETPPSLNVDDLKKILPNLETRFDLNNKQPAVVRVNQFTADDYSHQLGRTAANRVFVIHMGMVWKMKVKEIARYSGRTLTLPSDNKKQQAFFIWIFLPDDPAEAVPATWGEILPRLSEWIKS